MERSAGRYRGRHDARAAGDVLLWRRVGLGTDHEHTLADIARRLSVSRERVRQIEARAMAKLRPPSAA